MAIPLLNVPENSPKLENNPKDKSHLKSVWAFLLSVLVYASVFYFFNLSPSSLFCSTKFWFFISNTLVLIIAVDFEAFSSSEEHEFYDKNTLRAKVVPSVESQDEKIIGKTTGYGKEEVNENPPQEKILNMVVPASGHDMNHQTMEYNPQILSGSEKSEKKKQEMLVSNNIPELGKSAGEQKRSKATCFRSNSDVRAAITATAQENEGKLALQKTLSERHEEPCRLEENEFLSMSDEELNRRIEEFIRRFNRQMRLQAAQARQDKDLRP